MSCSHRYIYMKIVQKVKNQALKLFTDLFSHLKHTLSVSVTLTTFLKQTVLSRAHSHPPAAQEEDVDEERNITSSTSTDSQSLVLESVADASLYQQQLPSASEEGDEGSCELSDEVSRDSTMGSDSDTFSSPFCLSPVSEALCESSGSVFLDCDSRSVTT